MRQAVVLCPPELASVYPGCIEVSMGSYLQERAKILTGVFGAVSRALEESGKLPAVVLAVDSLLLGVDVSNAMWFKHSEAPIVLRLVESDNVDLQRQLRSYYSLPAYSKDLRRGQFLQQNPNDVVHVGDRKSLLQFLSDKRGKIVFESLICFKSGARRVMCGVDMSQLLLGQVSWAEMQPNSGPLDTLIHVRPITELLFERGSDFRVGSDDPERVVDLCLFLQRHGRWQESSSIAERCVLPADSPFLGPLLKARAVAAIRCGDVAGGKELYRQYFELLQKRKADLSAAELADCSSVALLENNYPVALSFALDSLRKNPFQKNVYKTVVLCSPSAPGSEEIELRVFEYCCSIPIRQAVEHYKVSCARADEFKPLRLFYFSSLLLNGLTDLDLNGDVASQRINQARRLLEQAVALLVTPYPAFAAQIFGQYGHLIARVKGFQDVRDARQYFDLAVKVDDANPFVLVNYASHLLLSGDTKRGLELARKAYDLPNELWTNVSAAFLLTCYGNAPETDFVQALKTALEMSLLVPLLDLKLHVKKKPALLDLCKAMETRNPSVIQAELSKNKIKGAV